MQSNSPSSSPADSGTGSSALLGALLFPLAAAGQLLRFIGGVGYLLRDTAAAFTPGLFGKRGRRLGWQNLWAQMDRVGVQSIPIVSLVLFCIGGILALQLSPILREYGMVSEVSDVIAISICRELGPLMAAIVLSGFAGASIAAEIGTMVVSEEIEAMQAHAIEPTRFLVLPRVLATGVMLICVSVIADIMGMAGGLVVAHFALGLGTLQYITHTFEKLRVHDFVTGLVKAGVFGVMISSLACYLGLGVTGGAMGVGRSTTRTVVLTIVGLIAVDLMFSGIFYWLGW